MKKIETIIIEAPSKRSLGGLLMSTPLSAPRPHKNKKAYDRKRDKKNLD